MKFSQTVIDYSLNKHLKTNVNGKVIECGIGIDYGKGSCNSGWYVWSGK